MLAPYVKNNQVMLCPSANFADQAGINTPMGMTYGWNIYAYRKSNWSRKFDDIPSCAQTIMLGDREAGCVRILSDGCADTGCTCYGGNRPAQNNHYLTNRHNDGANYAFFDGHAKWIKTNIPTAANSWYSGSPDLASFYQ